MVLGKLVFGRETPVTILEWSNGVFGPRTPLEIAIRTSKEINELMTSVLNNGSRDAIQEEIADCHVMMWQVARLCGIDVRECKNNALNKDVLHYLFRTNISIVRLLEQASGVPPHTPHWDDLLVRRILMNLSAIATKFNFDIAAGVDAKMKVNRARTWVKHDNGSFQHV